MQSERNDIYVEWALTNSQAKGGLPVSRLDVWLAVPHDKETVCYEIIQRTLDLICLFEQPKKQEMDMRFLTCNVRSLFRSDSLKTVAIQTEKYESDLVGMQKVRWDKIDPEPTDIFFSGNGNSSHHLYICFFIHREAILAAERVWIFSNRMLCVTPKGIILVFICQLKMKVTL